MEPAVPSGMAVAAAGNSPGTRDECDSGIEFGCGDADVNRVITAFFC